MGSLLQMIVLNSLNMTLVALLLMLILRAFKGIQSPKIRYYSWLIVFIGFLVPVRFSFGLSLIHFANRSGTQTVSVGTGTPLVEVGETGISWSTVLVLLTVLYVLGVLAFVAISLFRFSRWKRTILRLSHASSYYDAFAAQLAEDMEITSVNVRVSEEVSSPMMIGLTSPTIFLPNRNYEYDELRLILKHELMHFQHRDLWIKLLLIICRAVHWFNPFMVLFQRSIEQECEYYCDMSVMKDEPEMMRKVYCVSIVNTLADQVRRKIETRPALATSFYSPKSGLKHRFTMVLGGKKRKIIGILVLAGLLTIVSGFVLGGNSVTETKSTGREKIRENVVETTGDRVENTTWDEVEETTVIYTPSTYEEYTTWQDIDYFDEPVSSQYYTGEDDWVEETEWDETTAT